MTTRNRYEFKWWHGLFGLIGLSMVLGTIRAVATNGRVALPPGGASYRNHVIVLEDLASGVRWRVLDPAGTELEDGMSLTRSTAHSEAQRFIDSYIALASPANAMALRYMHPAQVQTIQGAVGYGPRMSGRPGQLTSPPLDGYVSWQDKWGPRRR